MQLGNQGFQREVGKDAPILMTSQGRWGQDRSCPRLTLTKPEPKASQGSMDKPKKDRFNDPEVQVLLGKIRIQVQSLVVR